MTMPPLSAPSLKLYDLSFVETICRGNINTKNKMLETFVLTIPLDVERIKEAHSNNNFPLVSQIAHKIKPVLSMYGIQTIADDINSIENLAKDEPGHPELYGKILKVDEIVSYVTNDIKSTLINP
jgi:HPt (histidine-containing phosphotransfer) domain-containing protein